MSDSSEAVTDTSELWLRRFHPAEHSPARLVCFPHAGGSASYFFPMSAALSPALDVLSVQYPGRQDRRMHQPIDDIPRLADRIFDMLRSQIDRPVAFFGHSMGAILAFEVAMRLEHTAGIPLLRLFASGRRAPGRSRHETVHLRDDAGLVAELNGLNGTDSRLLGDEEMLRLILPMVRSDYRAIETYSCPPDRRLSCATTALVGDRDPKTTLDEARSWSVHTTGEFDLRVFSGGHFFLNHHQRDIVNMVSAALAAHV
jgi:surfactin synthase thioesterase subunit